MNAVPHTAHSNRKRPAVRERLIHPEVAADGERPVEPLARFAFERVVAARTRLLGGRCAPINQGSPDSTH
jgi:hypothetical protein